MFYHFLLLVEPKTGRYASEDVISERQQSEVLPTGCSATFRGGGGLVYRHILVSDAPGLAFQSSQPSRRVLELSFCKRP
jgi:hypothetical protein